MLHQYPKSILATTHVDRHGESWSKDDLLQFASSSPNGLPMKISHDMTKSADGIVKNLRVEKIEQGFALIGDIFTEKPIDLEKFPALSIGACGLFHVPQDTKINCYLPRPFYNDSDLIKKLMSLDHLAIGKIIRKDINLIDIGLITNAVAFILGPEWDIQYKKRIRPILKECIEIIRAKLSSLNITVDIEQTVLVNGVDEIQVLLIPYRGSDILGQDINDIDRGISIAVKAIKNDCRPIKKVTLLYDSEKEYYKVINILYQNGEETNMP